MERTTMDISTSTSAIAKEDEGQTIHIRDASGEKLYDGMNAEGTKPKPVTITVAGTYSTQYRRAQDTIRERAAKRRAWAVDSDQAKKNELQLTAACILAWDGFTDAGKPFPCTKENALKLLELAPWVHEQVATAMLDHAGFFSPSSTP